MKRRLSDQDAQSRSDASSNGLDTDSDLGHSGASSAQNTRRVREKILNHTPSPSAPPHPPQPIKKKRTRTLTTPQQSAALHALLAQVIHLRLPHLPTNPLISVPLSYDGDARTSWTVDWVECSKSTGAFSKLLIVSLVSLITVMSITSCQVWFQASISCEQ